MTANVLSVTKDGGLKAQAAADYLDVSRRYLATLVKRGEIRACRMGKRCVRFRKEDLDAFLAAKVA